MKTYRKSRNSMFLFGTRVTTLMAVLTLFTVISAEATANLLINGDFEMGSLTGWTMFTTANGTTGAGVPDVVYSDTCSPGCYSNCSRFNVGRALSVPDYGQREGGGILQSVSLVAGNYDLSACIAMLDNRGSGNNDGGLIELLFDGVVVDSYDFGEAVLNVKEWASLSKNLVAVSAGVHQVGIDITRNYWSTEITPWQYVDDVVLIPEPGTVLLLGLGGLALMRKRRG